MAHALRRSSSINLARVVLTDDSIFHSLHRRSPSERNGELMWTTATENKPLRTQPLHYSVPSVSVVFSAQFVLFIIIIIMVYLIWQQQLD